jgi:predicted nuclease with RNAse H fold
MASEHARRWVGVDVGGPRKGFDVAVLDDRDRVRLHRTRDVDEVVAMATGARLLGIDAPAAWAPDGERSRPDERAFAAAGVCGIRFTPDEATARARTDDYLGWVWQGLALGAALSRAGVDTVEVFPTAAWTRWLGPRGDDTRLVWARAGLARLRADGLDDDAGATPSQDAMDAIAAALVTRQADRGDVDRFGTLAVPATGRWPLVTSVRR